MPALSPPSASRLIVMGAAATLTGVGLGRLAYAALLPGLISAGWLSPADAGYVGAANLLGYLVGALLASPASRRLGAGPVIKASALLIGIGFAANAWPGPVWWFTLWRFVAGVTGAFLMVIAPSLIGRQLPESKRKRGITWIFTGIGIGVFLSATLVPALIQQGLAFAWLGLALVCVPAIWLVWAPWPEPVADNNPKEAGKAGAGLLLALVYLAYSLDAVGFIPHTVFWVDYLERQRDFTTFAAASQWGLFALGAIAGPFIAGALARRIGWHRTLLTAFTLKGSAVLLPAVVPGLASISVSSFTVGAMIPGMVATTAGRIGELVAPHQQTLAWGRATALFAIAQAGSAYLMATLYAHADNGALIFRLGGSALLTGAAIVLLSPWLARQPKTTGPDRPAR